MVKTFRLRKTRSAAAGEKASENSGAKKLPQMAAARLLIGNNARPAAARFISENSNRSHCCATAGHNPANACNHYGWWRRHAFVPTYERSCQTCGAARGKISDCRYFFERSCQTCGAARGKISDCRYSHQQLPEFRTALDLCAHAIQQHVVTSTYSSQLQIRQFLAELCGYSCCSANVHWFPMVPGYRRRGAAKHALLPRAPVRLLPDFKRRPALPHGFPRAAAPAHSLGCGHHAGHQTGPSTSSFRVRHHAKRSRSADYPFRRKTDRRGCAS